MEAYKFEFAAAFCWKRLSAKCLIRRTLNFLKEDWAGFFKTVVILREEFWNLKFILLKIIFTIEFRVFCFIVVHEIFRIRKSTSLELKKLMHSCIKSFQARHEFRECWESGYVQNVPTNTGQVKVPCDRHANQSLCFLKFQDENTGRFVSELDSGLR